MKRAFTLADAPANAADFDVEVGASVRFYTITPNDAARMRDMQKTIRGWDAAGTRAKGLGSLGIALDACTVAGKPDPDALVSVYVRTDTAGAFMPLLRRQSLIAALGPELFAKLKPCAGGQMETPMLPCGVATRVAPSRPL